MIKQLLAGTAMAFALSACHQHEDPHFPGQGQGLDLVFADSTYQLTGVAKQDGGKLLVNYPRWSAVYKYAVTQVTGLTSNKPYPDEATNNWNEKESGKNKWVCVQSVYADDDNNIWVLDPAAPFLKTIVDDGPKLVKMEGGMMAKKYFFK